MHNDKLAQIQRLVTNALDTVVLKHDQAHIHFHATEEDLKLGRATLILTVDPATNSIHVASSSTLTTRNWGPAAWAIQRGAALLHLSGMRDAK